MLNSHCHYLMGRYTKTRRTELTVESLPVKEVYCIVTLDLECKIAPLRKKYQGNKLYDKGVLKFKPV